MESVFQPQTKIVSKPKKTIKYVYQSGDNILIVRYGTTANNKIAPENEYILQFYTFSRQQYEYANNGQKIEMKDFFKLDKSNCLNCPYSGNSGNGECYTHKYQQYSGFLSMLRNTKESDILPLPANPPAELLHLASGLYVRFGSYGESIFFGIEFISAIACVARKFTGYTHQYLTVPEFSPFFMSSVHTVAELRAAERNLWRGFLATNELPDKTEKIIRCPADKKGNKEIKASCSTCGLCSGTAGSKAKSVFIESHYTY